MRKLCIAPPLEEPCDGEDERIQRLNRKPGTPADTASKLETVDININHGYSGAGKARRNWSSLPVSGLKDMMKVLK